MGPSINFSFPTGEKYTHWGRCIKDKLVRL